MFIARRSWLTLLLSILVAVAGSTIPLVLMTGRQTSCSRQLGTSFPVPLFLPNSPIVPFFSLNPSSRVLTSTSGIAMTLRNSTQYLRVTDVTMILLKITRIFLWVEVLWICQLAIR